MTAYRHFHTPRFRNALIHEKSEVYKALRTFFSAEVGREGGESA